MTDVWQFWRDALAGKNPPITADNPECGFYKCRDGRGGKWLPVMIRHDDSGELRCRVGNNSNADPLEVWTWCAGNPISQADAKHAFETGSFPGDAPLIGDNSGDLSLAEQVTEYAAQALSWLRKIGGIKDKSQSDMAANYRAELLRLAKEADKQRDAEKRPHLEAGREIDAKYKPLVDEAKSAADELRSELTRWMNAEEKRLEAERRAKWELEQKAIEAARKEAEALRAKKMAEDPIAALIDPEPELPTMAAPPEPVKVQAGGQRGRKTGLREVTTYMVTDHTAALAFFAESEDVKALVQKLAERASKAGVKVPGVEIRTEKVAA
jgi:hypothetical protein